MAGKRKRETRRPTIIDVAREAQVGVMTVSRVLNNHKSVRPSTHAKVMKAIAKIGYSPNDAARMLKGRSPRTIGLVVPDLSSFFADCFHAVQEVAFQNDFQTLVVATGKNPTVEDEQLENLQKRHVAGIVVVPSGKNEKRFRVLLESGIPIVALDRPAPGVPIDSVLIENREGAEMAVRHLIEHKYKKIACVGFDSGSYTVRERFRGYERAVRNAGLERIVYSNVNGFAAMQALVDSWKNNRNWPRAIFTVKHISSMHLIQSLYRQKLHVPQDVALIGFDDFELAEVLGAPMTVVRQSPTNLARAASELLFQKIADSSQGRKPETQPSKTLFPAELVVRKSCGCTGGD